MAVVTIVADLQSLADSAATHLTTCIEDAIRAHGNATVCLTGGGTARPVYEAFANPARPFRTAVDWPRLHLFWSDERHVPPDHSDSNFGMAVRAMLRHVPVPETHIHRIRGELPDARDAARAYEPELAEGFARAGRSSQTFDVMLLGVGEDAHIASVFPGSSLLSDGGDRVAAVWAAHLNAWRITLTPAALLDAAAIAVIAAGPQKAYAVEAALELPPDVPRWPAQLLRRAADRVTWIIDRDAAQQLGARR